VIKFIKLFIPVLFPSWRFFSGIGASPRIQYAFLQSEQGEPETWNNFRVIPPQVGFKNAFVRLFFNPVWNETLYINTCAEHLFEEYSAMREQEIMRRLLAAIERGEVVATPKARYLVYRIVALIREGEVITSPVAFISRPALLATAKESK
jgi:hypothetical protein